jgi:hypothetical protein
MYAKVFAQMYDGSLCTQGPWEALVTFQQFLVLADQEGVVDMTAEAIARRTTIPLEIIERGIACLLLPDKKSRTPTEDGRRLLPLSAGRDWGWVVVNYVHYRQLKREADRREYHRDYWHKRKTQPTQHTQPSQPIAEAKANANEETPKTKTPRKRETPCPDGVTDGTWQDWLTLRKAKRAPVTDTVVKEAATEAKKAGLSLDAFLRVWCARGSQGLQADWLKPSERGKPETLSKWIKGTSLDPDFQGYPDDEGGFNANVPALR